MLVIPGGAAHPGIAAPEGGCKPGTRLRGPVQARQSHGRLGPLHRPQR
jgi:hypothetical protein